MKADKAGVHQQPPKPAAVREGPACPRAVTKVQSATKELAVKDAPTIYPAPWMGENKVKRVRFSVTRRAANHQLVAGKAKYDMVIQMSTEKVVEIIDAYTLLKPLARQEEAATNNPGDAKNWRIINRWLVSTGTLTLRLKVTGRTDATTDIFIADTINPGIVYSEGQTAVEGDAAKLVNELLRAYTEDETLLNLPGKSKIEGCGVVLRLGPNGAEISRDREFLGCGVEPRRHVGWLRNQRQNWTIGRTIPPSAAIRLMRRLINGDIKSGASQPQ